MPQTTTVTGASPFDSLASVKQSGYLAAPIPVQLGGFGVASVHDLLVASSRLARGEAALTLGVNMHLVFVLNVARRWQIATAAGDERRARAFGKTLEEIAQDGTVFASAGSERGGPHTPDDEGEAHRDGLGRRRAQGVLHDGACRRRPLHRRHLHRRRRW